MRLLVTKDCESHHTNPNYRTLIVYFDGSEWNVRPRGLRANWQPTDTEVMGLVRELAELSPTFAEQLIRYAYSLDTWADRTLPKSGRVLDVKKSNVAEILL
jgi:hypothetical protein